MSKSTISTFQLFEMFPTPESARIYLESRLWPDGPFCPECKSRERIGKQPKERNAHAAMSNDFRPNTRSWPTAAGNC